MATALVLSEEDRIFQNRVHGAIQTVQAWEQDPELFRRCRDFLIPWDALRDDEGRYSEADDHARFQNANVVFVQRLARFFKSFMTWVNNPQCCQCGSTETVHKETRGPNSDEERKGGANRVEVYTCPTCSSSETVFPRYNSVRKLLETRQGRCGEYANLFGLFCRATGLETRYILDFTDHVWTEVYLLEQWIMVDSCEGVIDEPSMYESGWGKELNYVLAISMDHVADVTPRYTRNWSDADFQARRRAVTTSEAVSQSILQRLQENLQHNFSRKVREEMARRLKHEDHVLRRDQEKTSWKQRYRHGRLSGSLVWKAARQEVGSNDNHSQNSDAVLHQRFRVEAFYPRSANPSIIVDPKPSIQFGGVVVTGCACAIGGTKALSIVVIDEKHRGCILQSRSFPTLSALGSFVDTIPKHRIVVVRGHIDVAGELTNATVKAQLSRLGGFKAATVTAGCMYIGQVEVKPNWAVCKSFDEASYGIRLNLSTSDEYVYCKDNIRLQKEENTRPLCIEGRLPESFLPLQAQLLASDEQKRAEFLRYISEYSDHFCSGFCTKQRAPIYLLGPSSYPFEQVNDIEASDVWNSFLLLPSALVALDDTSVSKQSSIPLFEVPVDTEFFVRSLGQQLLSKTGSSQTLINTSEALSNKRLLALYFSGSWCAPCRQFTPVLAELYSYLAEKFPSHGLEIVFVSSDRDSNDFDNYIRCMPWLAIPWEGVARHQLKQSSLYGVRGIPSIVVLDTLSGEVILPGSRIRSEVMSACNQGSTAIETMFLNWLDQVPTETKDIIAMLKESCLESLDSPSHTKCREFPYLTRVPEHDEGDISTRIKTEFIRLVDSGTPANEAAAKIITACSSAKNPEYPAGDLQGLFLSSPLEKHTVEAIAFTPYEVKVSDEEVILATSIKYVTNSMSSPWNPKFRCFKLSNKIADRVTRISGGLNYLRILGFELQGTSQDFVAFIPLPSDLHAMLRNMQRLHERLASK